MVGSRHAGTLVVGEIYIRRPRHAAPVPASPLPKDSFDAAHRIKHPLGRQTSRSPRSPRSRHDRATREFSPTFVSSGINCSRDRSTSRSCPKKGTTLFLPSFPLFSIFSLPSLSVPSRCKVKTKAHFIRGGDWRSKHNVSALEIIQVLQKRVKYLGKIINWSFRSLILPLAIGHFCKSVSFSHSENVIRCERKKCSSHTFELASSEVESYRFCPVNFKIACSFLFLRQGRKPSGMNY